MCGVVSTAWLSDFAGRADPRMCGVVSHTIDYDEQLTEDPPHVRGCIERRISMIPIAKGSPACAGLYRQYVSIFGGIIGIPRMCGVVSYVVGIYERHVEDPPHVRGCIGFEPIRYIPTKGSPRMCGVVSGPEKVTFYRMQDTPHVPG